MQVITFNREKNIRHKLSINITAQNMKIKTAIEYVKKMKVTYKFNLKNRVVM